MYLQLNMRKRKVRPCLYSWQACPLCPLSAPQFGISFFRCIIRISYYFASNFAAPWQTTTKRSTLKNCSQLHSPKHPQMQMMFLYYIRCLNAMKHFSLLFLKNLTLNFGLIFFSNTCSPYGKERRTGLGCIVTFNGFAAGQRQHLLHL